MTKGCHIPKIEIKMTGISNQSPRENFSSSSLQLSSSPPPLSGATAAPAYNFPLQAWMKKSFDLPTRFGQLRAQR